MIRQVRCAGQVGQPATKNLAKLLASLRKTGGYEYLTDFIFNSGGAVNGFDSYGHFLRAYLPFNNCVGYEVVPEGGCSANFDLTRTGAVFPRAFRPRSLGAAFGLDSAADEQAPQLRREAPDAAADEPAPSLEVEPAPADPAAPESDEVTPEASPSTQAASSAQRMRAARDLLDFLIGERGREAKR